MAVAKKKKVKVTLPTPTVIQERKLNDEQMAAIVHGDGPLLIIAGAGTGKTTVVTERIKHLISAKNVKPSEILALTFTEKAAREMEERIDQALPYGYTQMWIMTFHSFCDRILRREALHIGFNPQYKLSTEAEIIQFVRSNLFKFDLEYFRPLGNPTKFIAGILQHFSRLQDEDVSPSEYLAWVNEKSQMLNDKSTEEEIMEIKKWEELADAYKTYEELKAKESLMDFGDLIVKTLKLFRERPNVLNEYREQFKYILVDEFQDTNYAQNELAILLAGKRRNITVCGDDDQSIYRFRGAAVSNILLFRKTYPEVKVITLIKNYRSAQEILDRSYNLILNNNPDRLEYKEKVDKRLVSQRQKTKSSIAFIHKDRVENEADAVAKKINELHRDEKIDYSDFAILVRANNHSEPFLRAFQRHGIPYQFLGPGRLFKQPEIIDLISYLKVLYSFEDSLSFYRLLSVDYFNIPQRDLIKIGNYAKRQNLSLYEACEKINDIFVADETKETVTKLVAIINNHLTLIKKETAGQLLYRFLEETGLLQKLLNPDTPNSEKRAANIAKLFDKLKTYEVDHEDASVIMVVDWIDLLTELGESPLSADSDWTNVNAVNILTVHSAKGLEFPVVFLVNLVSQRFPTTERREQIPIPEGIIKEVLPEGDYHIQEERRLFYVGMTRARDHLYLTAADFYGEGKREKKLSQFIFEALGDDIVSSEAKSNPNQQLSFLDFASPHLEEHIEKPLPFHVDFLSYSQIETFKICPLHYKFRYLLRLPSPPSAALSFGTSMHFTLRDFYNEVKRGEKASGELLLDLLNGNWIREGYLSKNHEENMKEKGKKYLQEFYTNEYKQNILPVALEHNFTVNLTPSEGRTLKIGGKIDRIDLRPDGKIEIIDYKTSSANNIPSQKEVDGDLQLTFYALAATLLKEEPFNRKPEDILLTLYYFDTQTKLHTKRTKEQLDAAIQEIFNWREQIEQSDFACNNGFFCQNCEFQMFCSGKE